MVTISWKPELGVQVVLGAAVVAVTEDLAILAPGTPGAEVGLQEYIYICIFLFP